MEIKLIFIVILTISCVLSEINADETSPLMETTLAMEQSNAATESIEMSQTDAQPVVIETKIDMEPTAMTPEDSKVIEEDKPQGDQPQPDASVNEVMPTENMMKNSPEHMESATEVPILSITMSKLDELPPAPTQTETSMKPAMSDITTIKSTTKQKQQSPTTTLKPQRNSATINGIKLFMTLTATFSLFYF